MGKANFAVGTALALVFVAPAFAQDAPPQRGFSSDIVVTATRREQRLQDVPVAVSALSSDTLQTRGINSIGDLGAGKVPGLTASPLFGSEVGLQVYIRGFGAGDASQGTQDLPVALYIDGVNFPRAQGAAMDLVTPERIEVLRGPQGTLFGRNAHSGAVQIISKRPEGEWAGDFSVTSGTYNTIATKGRLDLPEMAGFRVQLSGNFRKHDGYIQNPYNPNYTNVTLPIDPAAHVSFRNANFNGDFHALKTYGGRIAIERDFGDLNVFYAYDNSWARDDQGQSFLVRSDEVGTIFTGFDPNPPTDLSFSNFSGPGGSQVTFVNELLGTKYPRSQPYGTPRIPFTTKSQGHVLNLTYAASDNLTLRSITGARKISREGGNTLNAVTSTFITSAFEYMRSEMFSQEVQAIFDTTDFNLTAGALYFDEDVLDERASGLAYNCISPIVVAAANCVPGSSQATTAPHSISGFKRSLSSTKAYGVYAQAAYTLGPVELIGGLRYSNDTKKAARVIDRNLGIDVENGVGVVRRNRFHTSRVDPAFTAKFNFNDDINVYGRYAVGYRDGGSSVRSNIFSSFNEDELESWEVGVKSQLFDRRVIFNVAAFHNTIKDQQLSIQTGLGTTPPNPLITDVLNSPEDRTIKGFEVELTTHPLRGLTISGSYTYLKANNILLGYDLATAVPFLPTATFSPQTGLIPDAATIAAHPNSQLLLIGPLGTPKHAGSINVDYEMPLPSGNLLFHVDWTRSSTFINAAPEIAKTQISATGVVTTFPSFNGGASSNRVNARIAFRDIPISGSDITGEFSIWAKNLFNEVDRAFAFVSGLNSVTILQPPRTMGADFRIRF